MSMEPLQDEKQAELLKHIDRLESLGQEWLGSFGRTQSGNAIIQVHAGSIGVWIVSCFAAFMAGCTIFLAFVVVGQQQQIDRASDYISNVYQALPEIRQFIDHERKKSP